MKIRTQWWSHQRVEMTVGDDVCTIDFGGQGCPTKQPNAFVRNCVLIAVGDEIEIDLHMADSDCLPGYVDFREICSFVMTAGDLEVNTPFTDGGFDMTGDAMMQFPTPFQERPTWTIVVRNPTQHTQEFCYLLTGNV